MKAYKEDQGRVIRLAAFWALIFMLVFGCSALHEMLSTQVRSFGEKIGGVRIPLVGWDLTWALLISLSLFAGGALAIHLFLQKPRFADLLIDTEAELKKVTWPTGQDVVNTSLIVVLSVLFLMGFLAASDWFIGRLMKTVLLGGG